MVRGCGAETLPCVATACSWALASVPHSCGTGITSRVLSLPFACFL